MSSVPTRAFASIAVIDKTPVGRAKPYRVVDESERRFVRVPRFNPHGTRGIA